MYKDFFSANLDTTKIVAIDSIDKKHDKISKNQALQLHQKYPKKNFKKLLQRKKVNVIIK